MMKIKSIASVKNLKNVTVLVRTDFNVPIHKGEIKDEFKILQQMQTITHLIEEGAKIILMTHLGEPEPGDIQTKFSIAPIAERIGGIIKRKVRVIADFQNFKTGGILKNMKAGDVVMLENIRFFKGEKNNDRKFAKSLASLADIYVNDAFAVSHREHASVSAIKKYLPSYAGLLLEQEVKNLDHAMHPQSPLVAVMGGAKISTKINLIRKLVKKSDRVLIGGGLANNFLSARGFEIGRSLSDKESVKLAMTLSSRKIILPVDVVVSTREHGQAHVRKISKVEKDDYIFDIGPETVRLYSNFIKKANTLIWNGPMGFYEMKQFSHGTIMLARVVGARAKGKAFGVVGGGETVDALKRSGMLSCVDWVSTGGGAMLSYLGGEKMPGLKKIVS